MNELKKLLIQKILAIQDEKLLKMLADILQLDDSISSEISFPNDEVTPLNAKDTTELQSSIDTFFNPISLPNQ